MYFTSDEEMRMRWIEVTIKNNPELGLSVNYYVDNGNKCDVCKHNEPFLRCLKIESAWDVVCGIVRYMEEV